jgi:hypothetical protein
MTRHQPLLALVAALTATACALSTHAVRITPGNDPPYQGTVEVSVTSEPEDGRPIAIVEISDAGGTVEKLMPAFLRRVAAEGGNFAKIDDIAVVFEKRVSTKTESYECGTKEKPETCERTVTETTEVGTLHILGRAFYVERGTP